LEYPSLEALISIGIPGSISYVCFNCSGFHEYDFVD
jgi:hypothetical protein